MKYYLFIFFTFLTSVILKAQWPEKSDFLFLAGSGITLTKGVKDPGYSGSIYTSYYFTDRSSVGLRMSFVNNERVLDNYNETYFTDFNSCFTYDYCFGASDYLSAHLGAGLGLTRICSIASDKEFPKQIIEDHQYKGMATLYVHLSIYEANALTLEYNIIPSTGVNTEQTNISLYHSYVALTYSLAIWVR